MKKLFPLFLMLIFTQSNFAQKIDAPQKIDEFEEYNAEILTVYIERLRIELNNNPTAKGYVVIYRSKNSSPGYPIRLGVQIKNFLIHNLETPANRFEIVNGGVLNEKKIELWIIPSGTNLPFPTNINYDIDPTQTVMFDNIPYPSIFDGGLCCAITGFTEQAKRASIAEFVRQLKKNPSATAYVIIYGQFCDDCSSRAVWSKSGKYLGVKPDIYFDSALTIRRVLNKEKNYISKLSKINLSKIKTINGGYRKWREMELWIVPSNSNSPELTPEVFPKKIYRNTEKIYQ